MLSAQNQTIHFYHKTYLTNAAKLDALSPLKVLTRGYAMVQSEDNEVIRSVNQVHTGESVQIKVSDGSIAATITYVEENEYGPKKSHI